MNEPDDLLSRDQVAELLGLEPDYVRKFLTRRGVREQRGYRRSDVEPLIGYQSQQGRRTDLHGPSKQKEAPVAGTVTLTSPEQARWIAEMTDLAANGHHVEISGATITMKAAALDVLADLPDDNDGHYDGRQLWIGGTGYDVITNADCDRGNHPASQLAPSPTDPDGTDVCAQCHRLVPRGQAAAQALADELTARGADWQVALPADAEVVHLNDPVYRDTVRLGDQQIYLTDYAQWTVLGWSDAAKSRQLRGQPLSTTDLWPSHGYDE